MGELGWRGGGRGRVWWGDMTSPRLHENVQEGNGQFGKYVEYELNMAAPEHTVGLTIRGVDWLSAFATWAGVIIRGGGLSVC